MGRNAVAMHPVLGCCGYRCDLCPAFRANVTRFEDQQRVSEGWHTYYGFQMPAERIVCDGCVDRRPEARRVDSTCPVRGCAHRRGLPTCATCPEFGCGALRARRVTRESVERRFGAQVPPDDVAAFILPYLGWARLRRLREEAPAGEPSAPTDAVGRSPTA